MQLVQSNLEQRFLTLRLRDCPFHKPGTWEEQENDQVERERRDRLFGIYRAPKGHVGIANSRVLLSPSLA